MNYIAFYHEIAHSLADDVAMWDYLAGSMGLDGVLFIDQLGDFVAKGDPRAFSSLPDLTSAHPSHKLIYLYPSDAIPEGWSSTMLGQFAHPTSDAIYVVGSNHTGIQEEDISQQNNSEVVSVECAYSLWSMHAGAIVLYSRCLQLG